MTLLGSADDTVTSSLYRRFRDRGRMAPEGVRYMASWTDLDFRRCFQVMEAANEATLKEWTQLE